MTYNFAILWVTALDIIGIVLCCLIIAYLIYNKIKYRRLIIDARSHRTEGGLNTKVLYHLMKQLGDQTFDAICDSVNQERQLFKHLIQNQVLIKSKYAKPESAYYSLSSHGFNKYPNDRTKIESDPDAYAQALNLAAVGLTVRQISERLSIPAGEIELLLKLNANKQKNPH